jgi:SAM-dependent methyltransferase
MSWEDVDAGWGRRAPYWAYLLEKQYWQAYDDVLSRLHVGPGTRYLDVACGSGLAASMAAHRGAAVSGIDAAVRLLAIAGERAPSADLRAGDMNALPWPDASFDVVTSFNAIWGPDQRALEEAARVVRPGGLVGLTFWGNLSKMEGFPMMAPLALCAPQPDVDEQGRELAIGRPGVAEAMFERAGLTPVERGKIEICFEFPDAEAAAEALAASGPAYQGILHSGEQAVLEAFREAARSLEREGLGVRAPLGWGFLIGRAGPAA